MYEKGMLRERMSAFTYWSFHICGHYESSKPDEAADYKSLSAFT